MTHAEARIIALQAQAFACQARIASMQSSNESARMRNFTFVPYVCQPFTDEAVQLEYIAAAINDFAQQLT